ncbi:hypothetical protein FUA23_11200 [Neolewinella aurantiaca]|uniref:Uncharacterized protein n=1 Tax=Neolewinella aurantiaca TaxID=2602767 RepID=A0A5C7FEX7_9BACT|nr:hypothetical protein [Neolewinella aurantiaca]TXF89305.1 hypothetical protein FUA23_11200 [Neolewinella aurantiaca]
MHKNDKKTPPVRSSSAQNDESNVILEIHLEKDLNQKLDQSAKHDKLPLEEIILKILKKRFQNR